MRTLDLPVLNDSYTVDKSADEYSRVQLDGGAGRYSKDLFGISDLVGLTFVLNPDEFDFLKIFYNVAARSGEEFIMNLLIDSFDLKPYKCRFIPSTFKITGSKGFATFVSATVEAINRIDDPISDDDYMILFDEFGNDFLTEFPTFDDRLNQTVNFDYTDNFVIPSVIKPEFLTQNAMIFVSGENKTDIIVNQNIPKGLT